MSELLVPVIAGVLQMKPEDVVEKIKTPEGVAEIETAAKLLKVFKTNDEYTNTLNTYRQSNMQIWKDELYKDHKTNIHAVLEKQLKDDFPELSTLEFKKDYQNTTDLIKKAIALNNKKSSGNKDEWEKEKEQLQNLIGDYKLKLENAPKEIEKKYKNRLFDSELNFAIELIAPTFNVEEDKIDSQKQFLKFLFSQQGITISETSDNSIILKDKDGNPILNDAGKPKTISTFITELAIKNIPIKENVPAGGRGAIKTTQQHGSGSMLEFATWDEYVTAQNKSGKQLIAGSKEANEAYDKWKKAHGK